MAPTWKELSEDATVPCRLPKQSGGFGKIGDPIELDSNFFPVTFCDTATYLCHFDVKIEQQYGDALEIDPVSESCAGSAEATNHSGKKKRRQGRKKDKPDPGKMQDESTSSVVSPCKKENTSPATTSAENRPPVWRIPKMKKMKIFRAFVQSHPQLFGDCGMAFDGEANAYSPKRVSQLMGKDPVHFQINFEDDYDQRKGRYRITLTLVKQAKLQTLRSHLAQFTHISSMPSKCFTIFQMLEIMFNYERMTLNSTSYRNQFFSQDDPKFGNNYAISGTKEGVVGFYCSLRPVEGPSGGNESVNLMLNVDVAHAAFYRCLPLLEFLNKSYIPVDTRKKLDEQTTKLIYADFVDKDIRVFTTHTAQPRTYRITGVSETAPGEHTLDIEGETMTVSEYFLKRYAYKIQYPRLQCLVANRNSKLPLEVCSVKPNQRVWGKLNDEESKQFVKQTAIPPHERLRQIRRVVDTNHFDADPMLKQLGIGIASTPQVVCGRVLPPPVVRLGGADVLPINGVWNNRGKKFFQPLTLDEWAVIDFTEKCPNIDLFTDQVETVGREHGMTTAKPLAIMRTGANPANPVDALEKVKEEHPSVNLILCIIDSGDSYKTLKSAADREVMVMTQCVLQKTVMGCEPQKISNLLLEFNAKLGGINHVALYISREYTDVFNEGVLLMGADINHPRPGSMSSTPSHAAVVCSTDAHGSKYSVAVRSQTARETIITDLKIMTTHLLRKVCTDKKKYPKRIVMFRDGVSETQFTEVLRSEVSAMREACADLDADFQPAITFICVQKRHKTRLFCKDHKRGDRSGNIPAGTVVDSVITQSHADFYLCSHQGIMGTSRPSHYTVLWDDNDFSMDMLQMITNCLCYAYSRCCRAVSLPTPVYYAHLAAFRAKVHLEGCRASNRDQNDEVQTLDCSNLDDLEEFAVDDSLSQLPYY